MDAFIVGGGCWWAAGTGTEEQLTCRQFHGKQSDVIQESKETGDGEQLH